MDAKRFTDWLGTVSGLVIAITGVLSALPLLFIAVTDSLGPSVKSFGLHPLVPRVAAGLLLAALFAFIWRSYRRFVKASRLERPDAFTLDATTPERLIGRDRDLGKLLDTVARNRVVLLDGESGCGKSALVGAGLVPRLTEKHGRLLPVLIRDWGDDWVRGPLASLLGALFESLSPEERTQLEWLHAPDLATTVDGLKEELEKRLDAVCAKLNRLPLVIADQFDDYQAQDREKFWDGDGNWLTPDLLAEANPFWGLVKARLVTEQLQLLVITRSDTASGLSCVRFLDQKMTVDRPLDRVELDYLHPLLAGIASADATPPIVSDPEHGWDELRDRLEKELRPQGAILMQQIRTMLHGLRLLPMLTVRAYRQAGGLLGLEVLVIRRALERARLVAGGEDGERQARTILGALVLPGGPNRSAKAKRSSESELQVLAGGAHRSQMILQVLQEQDVVRPAEGSGSANVWQLDHDYLARAVLAEARQADQWGIALREGWERYRQAEGSWRLRWKALLPISVQVRLVWERLRGRLMYGEALGFARKSAMKPGLVSVLAIVLAASAYVGYQDLMLTEAAKEISDRFGGPNEAAAVMDTWRAPARVRQRLYRHVLKNPNIQERALISAWPIAHSGLNASPSHGDQTKGLLQLLRHRSGKETNEDREMVLAKNYVTMARTLTNQKEIRAEVAALRAAMIREDQRGFKFLEPAYISVAQKLTGEKEIQAEVAPLRAAMLRGERQDFRLIEAYISVAQKLTDQDRIQAEVAALRVAIEGEDPTAYLLEAPYVSIAQKLTDPKKVQNELAALRVARIRNRADFSEGYAAVAENLSGVEEIEAEIAALSTEHLGHLVKAYALLIAKLNDQKRISDAAIEIRTHLNNDLRRASAYATVGSRLNNQEVIEEESKAWLAMMLKFERQSYVILAAKDYAVVAKNLTNRGRIEADASMLFSRLHERWKGQEGFIAFACAYAAVAINLRDQGILIPHAKELYARLFQEWPLAIAYAAVAPKLADQRELEIEVKGLHEALRKELKAKELSSVSMLAGVVSEGLPSNLVESLIHAYVAVAPNLTNPKVIKDEVEALHSHLLQEHDEWIVTWLAKMYAVVVRKHLEMLVKNRSASIGEAIKQVLVLSGHPYLGDPSDLLASLEPVAKRSFGSDTGAAVSWWVKQFKGNSATLRPQAIQ